MNLIFCRVSQELIVSIPLRLGKKVIAHHTLLTCTGQATPSASTAYKPGDVIWAMASGLPAWPGKILAAEDCGSRVPLDKVSVN
jgi:hypothetical protein